MLVLALPRDVVEAALLRVERLLERRPEAWSHLAARGKLRRLLGERCGLDDLRAAADAYLRAVSGPPSLQTPANLYRLAGDARAQALLERLREEVVADLDSSTGTGTLVDTCFLLGDDEGALQSAPRVAAGPAGQRHRDVALLAAGRARGDVGLLDEAVASLTRVATSRPFAAGGGMDAHDWLEIALVTRVQVSGEPSARLVEL